MSDTSLSEPRTGRHAKAAGRHDPGRASVLLLLPELGAATLAAFTLPGMVMLQLDHFSAPLAGLLGLLCAALAAYLVVTGGPPSATTVLFGAERSAAFWTLAALVIVVAFVVLNSLWSAQDLFATRDPATYGLAGRWLVDHSTLRIPVHRDVFGALPGLNGESAGFARQGGDRSIVFAQANHGLPVLLGITGWLAGDAVLLRLNVLLGGLALLALFGLARRVVGGPLACLVVVAFGTSIPMLYVSRDTYSETPTLLVLMGGLSLLWRAQETRALRHYALAGFVLGSSSMFRIDSNAALLGVIVGASILLVVAPAARRREQLVATGVLAAASVVPLYLGYRDLTALSPGYYYNLTANTHSIAKAAFGLAVLGAVAVTVAWRWPVVLDLIRPPARRARLALAAALAVVGTFAVLASRPFWLVTRDVDPIINNFIGALQRAEHLTYDPTRTYNEYTVSWQAWNYSWFTVVLAAAGLAALTWWAVARAARELVMLLSVGLMMSALYLLRAEITPDMAWAMRRYVPVIIPTLLIAAAYTIGVVGRLVAARVRSVGLAVGAGLAGVMALAPIVITYPMFHIRMDVPQYALVSKICGALPADAAVVLLDGSALSGYAQTMRSYCGVDAVGLVKASPPDLEAARAAAAEHGRTLYALALDGAAVPFAPGTGPGPFTSMKASRWPNRVQELPQRLNRYDQFVFLGPVQPGGMVAVLPRVALS